MLYSNRHKRQNIVSFLDEVKGITSALALAATMVQPTPSPDNTCNWWFFARALLFVNKAIISQSSRVCRSTRRKVAGGSSIIDDNERTLELWYLVPSSNTSVGSVLSEICGSKKLSCCERVDMSKSGTCNCFSFDGLNISRLIRKIFG